MSRILVSRSCAKSVKRPLERGWTYSTGFPVCEFVLAVAIHKSPDTEIQCLARGENMCHPPLSSKGSHVNCPPLAQNFDVCLHITDPTTYLAAMGT